MEWSLCEGRYQSHVLKQTFPNPTQLRPGARVQAIQPGGGRDIHRKQAMSHLRLLWHEANSE
jgi:hypothetical protein